MNEELRANTPGERALAGLLQEAQLREAHLTNWLARQEQEIVMLREGYDELRAVLTPTQKKKLGIKMS